MSIRFPDETEFQGTKLSKDVSEKQKGKKKGASFRVPPSPFTTSENQGKDERKKKQTPLVSSSSPDEVDVGDISIKRKGAGKEKHPTLARIEARLRDLQGQMKASASQMYEVHVSMQKSDGECEKVLEVLESLAC